MTYDELFYFLLYARRIYQALAALTGDLTLCEGAAVLDELADAAWKAVKQ